jgi:hypothetical protein
MKYRPSVKEQTSRASHKEAQVRIEKAIREVRLVFVLETAAEANDLRAVLLRQIKDGAVNLTLGKPSRVVAGPLQALDRSTLH